MDLADLLSHRSSIVQQVKLCGNTSMLKVLPTASQVVCNLVGLPAYLPACLPAGVPACLCLPYILPVTAMCNSASGPTMSPNLTSVCCLMHMRCASLCSVHTMCDGAEVLTLRPSQFESAFFAYLRATDTVDELATLGVLDLDQGPFRGCPICSRAAELPSEHFTR